jgi:hypothetical protein
VKEIDRGFFDEIRFLGNFHYPVSDENDEPYVILPTTKNPMWFIPVQNRSIAEVSLALYQPSLLRAKFLKQLAILLARSGLFRLIFKDNIYLKKNDEEIRKIFKQANLYYAIFTGTEGAHKKVTVQVMNQQGTILGYIKASDNEDIRKLLKNEAEILGVLSGLEIRSGHFPNVFYHGEISDVAALIIDTKKSAASTFSSKLSDSHISFLAEICLKSSKIIKFKESIFFDQLYNRMKSYYGYIPHMWNHRFQSVYDYLSNNMADKSIPFGLCHRDFTPWNTYFHEGKLFVFDWEYAEKEYPPLIDVFHFIVQDGILVRHLKPNGLLKRIFKNQKMINKYCDLIDIDKNLMNPLLLCYLLDISLLYIEREKGDIRGEIKDKIDVWAGMIDLIIASERGKG